jgi:Fe2+ transport system protein FeoA
LDGSKLAEADQFRFAELGMGPGTILRVEQTAGFGARVVRCGDRRFAIDGATARALRGHHIPAGAAARPAGHRLTRQPVMAGAAAPQAA